MKFLLPTLLFSLLLTGCFGRTKAIYITPGTATILRKEIKGAEVAAPGADSELKDVIVDIPKGALILYPKDK